MRGLLSPHSWEEGVGKQRFLPSQVCVVVWDAGRATAPGGGAGWLQTPDSAHRSIRIGKERKGAVYPQMFPPFLGWLPEEMHFFRGRSVCSCLSVCLSHTPEILGTGGSLRGTKVLKKPNFGTCLALRWSRAAPPQHPFGNSLCPVIFARASEGNKELDQGMVTAMSFTHTQGGAAAGVWLCP